MQQVMQAMEEEDNDIFGVSGSSKPDLSDKDNPSYVVPAFETCYSGNEAMIESLYYIYYESESAEEETPPDTSPSAPDKNL